MSDTTTIEAPSVSGLPELHPNYVVGEDGERCAVLLSIAEYEALLERIEDLQDAVNVKLALLENDFVSQEEAEAELKKAGIL